jgi:hypothetical protein
MVMVRISAMSNLGNKGFIEIRSFDRKVLSQGVTFIAIPKQNSPQVGMVLKGDPEKVIDLPL